MEELERDLGDLNERISQLKIIKEKKEIKNL
jgi:hypothetical protein